MAKQPHRKAETPHDLRQKRIFWRTAGVMAFALVALVVGYYLDLKRHEEAPVDEDHYHEQAAHGGLIVTLGDGGHYHIEVVGEKGGVLRLYLLGEDVARVVEVESQIVTAQVKPEGAADSVSVDLMPMPQAGDSQGKTSQFAVKLPRELREGKLLVSVPRMVIGGKHIAFEFKTAGFPPDGSEQEQERLYLTPGGKYTEADIHANGSQTAPQRFVGFQASHDARPRPGDRICPVSRTKANSQFTWIVGGKIYAFCCPPCIDEFVRWAKEQPQAIKEPEDYVKQ